MTSGEQSAQFMSRIVLLSSVLQLALAGNTALAADAANIFLITHSEVQIEASSDRVWPFVLDTSEWKTLAESSHYAGDPDELGEIELIRGESDGTPYQFFTETVELVPEKRKVIAIYFDEHAEGDVGYAAWTLFPNAEGTLVTYDVYSVSRVPGIAPDQVDALRQQVTTPNRTRFDEELRTLKQLIEGQ